MTVSDLDRLIRLEQFLRQDQESKGMEIVLCWDDGDGKSEEVGD